MPSNTEPTVVTWAWGTANKGIVQVTAGIADQQHGARKPDGSRRFLSFSAVFIAWRRGRLVVEQRPQFLGSENRVT